MLCELCFVAVVYDLVCCLSCVVCCLVFVDLRVVLCVVFNGILLIVLFVACWL